MEELIQQCRDNVWFLLGCATWGAICGFAISACFDLARWAKNTAQKTEGNDECD